MNEKVIKLFLRLAIAAGFLSAIADRFGIWHNNVAWGNWDSFVSYTATINPWLPSSLITATAVIATILEGVLALALLLGWKTKLFAQLSGYLLLLFGLSMWLSLGIKKPLDYSVFAAAAAAFALATFKVKFLEIDT